LDLEGDTTEQTESLRDGMPEKDRRSDKKRQSQKRGDPQQTGSTTRCHQQDPAKKTALLWTRLQNGKRKILVDSNERVCARTERERPFKEEMDRYD